MFLCIVILYFSFNGFFTAMKRTRIKYCMCLYQNKTYFLFKFKNDNHMQIENKHEGTESRNKRLNKNVNNSFVILIGNIN